MDIVVYLKNGQIHNFSQGDPVLAQATLAEIQPNRLFSGSSSLILGNGASCMFLNSSAISRIDVMTDQPVTIQPTIRDAATVMESEEAFRLRAAAASKAFCDGVAPGEEYLGYMCFELAGGFRLMVELKRVLQQQFQFFTNLHRMFDGSVICFKHPRGGAIILNVANIVSVEAAPGFAEYPKGALQLDAR